VSTLLDKLVDKIRTQASQKSFQDTEAFAWGDYPDDKDDVYSNGVDDGYIGFAKELLKIIESYQLDGKMKNK